MNPIMYLTQCLHRNLQLRASTTALVCGDTRRTYGDLVDRVARLAGALKKMGVAPGDRVAILALNSIGSIEAWFATWWIGAVICPINTRWSGPEIASLLEDARPKVLFADIALNEGTAPLKERFPSPRHVILMDGDAQNGGLSIDTLVAENEATEDGRFSGEHLAALLYTGGTTGRAKGVMLTQKNLWTAAQSRLADNEPYSDSICLIATPMFHVAALVRVLCHLFAGGCCVIASQFRPDEAIELIERESVTDVALVPNMLQMVLDHERFSAKRLRTVLRIGYGAAPSARILLARAMHVLPWVGLYQSYGMTESAAIGTMSRPKDHSATGWASAGQACSSVELRVVDTDGNDVPLDTIGEILLRGPTVMQGYWNHPQETAQALRSGWLHTGDVGKLSADGHLTIVDRLKDMIITGGENVYSAEVENALAQHPAVAQCCVIGVPDDRWGEAVHAVLVLRSDATVAEENLRVHCRGMLANYKCPKSFEVVSTLPLTAAGKVAKYALRERHWMGLTRRIN